MDLDCVAPGREGPQYFRDAEEALAALDGTLERLGLAGAADVIVGTGWGVQGWIRLSEPVEAKTASRWTRALLQEIKTQTGGERQIDRVWDVTRVLRFPGAETFNWRGGEGMESLVTVLRLPEPGNPGLALDKVAAALPVIEPDPVLIPERLRSGGAAEGAALLDLEAIFDRLPWSAVLEPYGWTRVGGHGRVGVPGEMDVWLRPGKTARGAAAVGGGGGERSAVVYGDAPGVLVVHTDSEESGLPGWWETRSMGGREEGGSRPANTRWNTWARLTARAQRLGGDETAMIAAVRAQALDIACGRDRVDDWPSVIIEALQDDGSVAMSWVRSVEDSSVDRARAAVDKIKYS